MLVNYFRNPERETAFNLFVARVVFVTYAIWKLLSYKWVDLTTWPDSAFRRGATSSLYLGEWYLNIMIIQVAITVLLLIAVGVGYRMGATGFLAALSLAHLSGVHYTITNQGSTWLPAVYILLLIAFYRHEDPISVDGYRRIGHHSLNEIRSYLRGERGRAYSPEVLRWTLVLFAGTYFLTGYVKIKNGVVDWASGANIGRIILWETNSHVGEIPRIAESVLEYPLLLDVFGWLTVIGEVGFLVAVFLGAPLLPFAVLLLGMHTMIGLTMQIFFFDQYIIFLLFVPFDRYLSKTRRDGSIIMAYPGDDPTVTKMLFLLKHLDVSNSIRMIPAKEVPQKEVQFDETRVAIIEEPETYTGVDAVSRALRQYKAYSPIAWLIDRPSLRNTASFWYSRNNT